LALNPKETPNLNPSDLGIKYNPFDLMSTGSRAFNKQNQVRMENLISKSTLISRTAEKIRNRFFKNLESQIEALKKIVEEEN
jgi:hypothetical protein